MGDTYLAAVGLSSPLLDHMPRAVEFARELRTSVANIAQAYELKLDLIVGISAGPVVTNVSHGRELMFQIWGEAVIEADFARDEAERGQIVVNDAIREALADKYRFERMAGERAVALWILTED
jgi:class 3 adenylate cyclase